MTETSSDPNLKATQSGHRHPALPYAVAGVLLAILMFGTAGFLWLGTDRAAAAIGGPFTLEDASGQTVTERNFHGKYMLVYFGYTFCPDVCPTTLNEIAGALDKLGAKADDIVPIFITVDPARDTPAVMKRYTQAFGPRIVGLTGTPAQIAAVTREYRVYYGKRVTGPGPNDYSMDHSSVLYLMGRDGQFIAVMNPAQSGAAMAASIAKDIS